MAQVTFSWEVAMGAGGMLALMAIVWILGGLGSRRPSGASRGAHEWLVLRDRIATLEQRVATLENRSAPADQTPAASPPPAPQPRPAVRVANRSLPPAPTAPTAHPATANLVDSAPPDGPEPTRAAEPPTLISVPELESDVLFERSTERGSFEDELEAWYDRICELSDAGQDADAIARGTGLEVDRVRRILGLKELWQVRRPAPSPEAQAPVPGPN